MNVSVTDSQPDTTPDNGQPAAEDPPRLTANQQSELLRLARATISAYLETGRIPDYKTTDPGLRHQAGVFVTLWTLGPTDEAVASTAEQLRVRLASRLQLRGCMGHTPADLPLFEAVQQVAITAATADPRVWPLSLEELPNTLIEISVLSPLSRLIDVNQLQIGWHGLLIIKEQRRGLLLPEVASRSGWDQFEFLENVCRKASLSPDSWSKAELYVFTTQKFGETFNADKP